MIKLNLIKTKKKSFFNKKINKMRNIKADNFNQVTIKISISQILALKRSIIIKNRRRKIHFSL